MSDSGHDLLAWEHAEDHLAEALGMSAALYPRSIVHASYYAMFHAARATLLHVQSDAPKKHESVVRQFGLLIKDSHADLRKAGRDFRAIRELRRVVDYVDGRAVTPEEGEQAAQLASAFMEACAQAFRFKRRVAR